MDTNNIVKAIIGVAVAIMIVVSVVVPVINGMLEGSGGVTAENPAAEYNKVSPGDGNIQISGWEEGSGTDIYHLAINGEEVESSGWVFISNILIIRQLSTGFTILENNLGTASSYGSDGHTKIDSFDLIVDESTVTLDYVSERVPDHSWPRSELSPYFYFDTEGEYQTGYTTNQIKAGPNQYMVSFEAQVTGSGFMGLAFALWEDGEVDYATCAPADAPSWADPTVTFDYTGPDAEGFYVFDDSYVNWTSSSESDTLNMCVYPVTAYIPPESPVDGTTATLIATVPVIIVAGLVIATIGSFIMSRR